MMTRINSPLPRRFELKWKTKLLIIGTNTDASFCGGETYWLANKEINRRHQILASGGRDYPSWVNFTVQHYLHKSKVANRFTIKPNKNSVDSILSIGSGDGALERHLASLNAANLIEGIDIARANRK